VRRLILLFLCFAVCAQANAARTLKDEIGREVTVPDHPHRLICLMPNVVDDLYALGASPDIIAVSDYTKYPFEAKSKPSIGPPLDPSLEMIAALHPDLVLSSGDMGLAETVNRIEQMGIPVFMIDPHGVEGIYRSLDSLGRVLNRAERAAQLVASLRRRETAVRERVRGKPLIPILMPVWYDPIMTIGSRAYITEFIALAGGRSVTSDIPQEWPQVSLEAILARAPEALLLVHGSKMSIDVIKNRPGWNQIPAVRNNRVYYVGDEINYPSPVAFDALEEMAREFHP
jgi:iron complex transport system substrate-binding protein